MWWQFEILVFFNFECRKLSARLDTDFTTIFSGRLKHDASHDHTLPHRYVCRYRLSPVPAAPPTPPKQQQELMTASDNRQHALQTRCRLLGGHHAWGSTQSR